MLAIVPPAANISLTGAGNVSGTPRASIAVSTPAIARQRHEFRSRVAVAAVDRIGRPEALGRRRAGYRPNRSDDLRRRIKLCGKQSGKTDGTCADDRDGSRRGWTLPLRTPLEAVGRMSLSIRALLIGSGRNCIRLVSACGMRHVFGLRSVDLLPRSNRGRSIEYIPLRQFHISARRDARDHDAVADLNWVTPVPISCTVPTPSWRGCDRERTSERRP